MKTVMFGEMYRLHVDRKMHPIYYNDIQYIYAIILIRVFFYPVICIYAVDYVDGIVYM